MTTASNFPSGAPLTGPDGRISTVWLQFFLQLFSRTGGTIGQDAAANQKTLSNALADIVWLQTQAGQGDPQPDIAALSALVVAAEAMAQQALATTVQKPDERGEVGDGTMYVHLLGRIDELNSKIEAMGAPPPAPAGYDTTTIGGVPRLIAYY